MFHITFQITTFFNHRTLQNFYFVKPPKNITNNQYLNRTFSLDFFSSIFLIFIKIIINIFKKKLIRVPDFELGFGIFKFWSNFWGWGTSLLFSQPTHLLHQFWTLSSTSIPWIDYARCGIGLPPMRGMERLSFGVKRDEFQKILPIWTQTTKLGEA